MPESDWKDEFVKQAKSALYLALGKSLFNKHKALPLHHSKYPDSIRDALHELQKSMELGNESAQPILAECHYFIAKKTYEEDTIDQYFLRKAKESLNAAEQLGTEELKQQIAELRNSLTACYQKKSEAAVNRFKADFPEKRKYTLNDNTLENLWKRLDFAIKYGTDSVQQAARTLIAKKEQLLSFNESLPDRPVYHDPYSM